MKENGLLVICQYCYSPRTSPIARDSEKLVMNINPTWKLSGFNGLYASHVDTVSDQYQYGNEKCKTKYEFLELFCYDYNQPFSIESWVGRMLTCNGVGSGTLDNIKIDKFKDYMIRILKGDINDKEKDEFLLQFKGKYNYNDDSTFTVKHRVWCTISAKIADKDHAKI